MANCVDLNLTFTSKDRGVLETLHPLLVQFFDYDTTSASIDVSIEYHRKVNEINKDTTLTFDEKHVRLFDLKTRYDVDVKAAKDNDISDLLNWYKILMIDDIDPATGCEITDERLETLTCRISTMDDVWDIEEDNGLFEILIGDSGDTRDTSHDFWCLVCDKHGVDLEISCIDVNGMCCAYKMKYKNGVYIYNEVELTRNERSNIIADNSDDDDETDLDDDFNADFSDEFREALYEKLSKLKDVVIDCETNYLDNLKGFVEDNIAIPNLDEHLVKSGLFKTSIGTEKRRRIEVEVNGVKLYADSKHGVKQRKSNVEKLKKLLYKKPDFSPGISVNVIQQVKIDIIEEEKRIQVGFAESLEIERLEKLTELEFLDEILK